MKTKGSVFICVYPCPNLVYKNLPNGRFADRVKVGRVMQTIPIIEPGGDDLLQVMDYGRVFSKSLFKTNILRSSYNVLCSRYLPGSGL